MKNKNGFTLIEALVAISIVSVILAGLYKVYTRSFYSAGKGSDFLFALSDMSIAVERIKQDLRTLAEPSMEHMARVTGSEESLSLIFFSVRGVLQDGTPVLSPVEYLFEKGTLSRKYHPLTSNGISEYPKTYILIKDRLASFDVRIFSREGKDITSERTYGIFPARLLFKLKHKQGAFLETIVSIYSPYIVNRATLPLDLARIPNYRIMPGTVSYQGIAGNTIIQFTPSRLEKLNEECLEFGRGMKLPAGSPEINEHIEDVLFDRYMDDNKMDDDEENEKKKP